MRSSPIRTFSPSDLCFDAGWIVHQQYSACSFSWRPTSNASLSEEEQVERQERYCRRWWSDVTTELQLGECKGFFLFVFRWNYRLAKVCIHNSPCCFANGEGGWHVHRVKSDVRIAHPAKWKHWAEFFNNGKSTKVGQNTRTPPPQECTLLSWKRKKNYEIRLVVRRFTDNDWNSILPKNSPTPSTSCLVLPSIFALLQA